jgi:hypothetical protein
MSDGKIDPDKQTGKMDMILGGLVFIIMTEILC